MESSKVRNILIVCTGNSCRSIMAEAYFRKRLLEEGLEIGLKSAGTMGISGVIPAENTIRTLEEENISTDGLISTGLTTDLVAWADLILVMEPGHKENILLDNPGSEGKILYLAEFREGIGNFIIPDPIGRPLSYYKMTFGVIKESVEGLLKWLTK